MATIGTAVTLADIAKRLDPNGKIDTLVELLGMTNEVLDDALFMECNNKMSHRTTVRSGLPAATWRQLNYGVQPDKSTTKQIEDATGMLEAYAEVDKALADLNGNTAAFRLSEDHAFIEGMNQEMATTLFYGDTGVTPERFMGLAPRYSDLAAQNAENIIDAGGTGSDNTSIWLVTWGDNTCHGLYPQGSQAGLQHKDLGEVTLTDAAGGRYQGYRTHYKWDTGLTLRDWRYCVRIANIDVSELAGGTPPDLITAMIEAEERIPNLGMGKTVWYANRTVRTALRKQKLTKANVHLTQEEVGGKLVTHFDEIPLRRCDAILSTEERVV